MYNPRKKKQNKNKTALIQACVFGIAGVSGLLINQHWKETNSPNLQTNVQATSTPIPTPTIQNEDSNRLPIQNTPIPTQSGNQVSRGDAKREEFIPEKVIKAIENNLDGVFNGKAKYIYDTSKSNNVNPMLVASIMKWETANGTSDLVKNCNNPAGLNWYKGCGYPKSGWYQKFPTLEVGIEKMIKLLKKYYIDEGLTDIYSIGAKYAPLDDHRNGIAGMDNNKWSPNITKFYEKMLEEAK